MDYDKCTSNVSDSNIVVKENKSSFQLRNPQRLGIKKIQVDGCLIDDDRERCDWLLVVDSDNPRALYVELKGSDIDKAIKQLEATLIYTKSDFVDANRECFVVSTRVPKYGPSVHKRALVFYKQNGATLAVKNIRAVVDA